MKLLMQSDDYGISPAVSAGIRKALSYGIIRNTGLFVNMPDSADAAAQLRGSDVCLGIDINYVCGRPVSDPALLPHMVDESGNFVRSGVMASRYPLVSMDEQRLISTFEVDPYPYEEVLAETEAQAERFVQLTGMKPAYVHMHSLNTPNTLRAAQAVAHEYGVPHTYDGLQRYPLLAGTFDGSKGSAPQDQLAFDVTENLLERCIPSAGEGETRAFICHCGWVDSELFRYTSLTLRRTKDLEAMTSPRVREYFEEHAIELVTWNDLAA